jgi:hypothetical protein
MWFVQPKLINQISDSDNRIHNTNRVSHSPTWLPCTHLTFHTIHLPIKVTSYVISRSSLRPRAPATISTLGADEGAIARVKKQALAPLLIAPASLNALLGRNSVA